MITEIEQEFGLNVHVLPFYKCNVIYTLTERYFWKLKTSKLDVVSFFET